MVRWLFGSLPLNLLVVAFFFTALMSLTAFVVEVVAYFLGYTPVLTGDVDYGYAHMSRAVGIVLIVVVLTTMIPGGWSAANDGKIWLARLTKPLRRWLRAFQFGKGGI